MPIVDKTFRTTGFGRRGTVLLLALLVLSSVAVASSGLATLIMSSLQQTRTIDSSIIAYYAAESAAEEAIFAVRKTPLEPGWTAALTGASPPLNNGASWTRTVTNKERLIVADIARDGFMELSLYDPDSEGESLAEAIKKVSVDWIYDTCVLEEDTCPKLVATLVRWDPAYTAWSEDAAKTLRFESGVDGAPPVFITLDNLVDLHKLRLRAEDADLHEVRIQAYADDAMNVPVDLPGRVKIDAYGKFGQTQQHLTVRLPRRTPLSGLYDFALFSECSLVKGYPISCP